MTKPDKREEIMRAALELVVEHGFHGAPMAMIAERANIAAGTIYRYFENKDVLITELYQDLEDRLYLDILENYPESKSVRERYIHLGTALLRYFIENPLDFRFVEQYLNSPYGVARRRCKFVEPVVDGNVFRVLFEEGISQQVMKDLPLLVLFDLSFGPHFTLARDHILGFIALDETMIFLTIEACWDAIRKYVT
jgi:AcrR family transcriptional regulator